VTIPIHPSNVVITKLKNDKNRNGLIERRAKAKGKDAKSEKGVPASAMSTVD
jgi:ribosomal protein L24